MFGYDPSRHAWTHVVVVSRHGCVASSFSGWSDDKSYWTDANERALQSLEMLEGK